MDARAGAWSQRWVRLRLRAGRRHRPRHRPSDASASGRYVLQPITFVMRKDVGKLWAEFLNAARGATRWSTAASTWGTARQGVAYSVRASLRRSSGPEVTDPVRGACRSATSAPGQAERRSGPSPPPRACSGSVPPRHRPPHSYAGGDAPLPRLNGCLPDHMPGAVRFASRNAKVEALTASSATRPLAGPPSPTAASTDESGCEAEDADRGARHLAAPSRKALPLNERRGS